MRSLRRESQEPMFGQPKYIQNSFSVSFDRCADVRRRVNAMEDLLERRFSGHFGQPQVIPVPDELDPEVPRVIFGSQHGFSQIIASQIALTLNVAYSPDWQVDISKGRQYLKERVAILYELLDAIRGQSGSTHFCGLITRVRLQSSADDAATIEGFMRRLLINNDDASAIYDFNLKRTTVVADRFFSNTTIQNYRAWRADKDQAQIPRLPRTAAIERGIELVGDFNDRFAFNENATYLSTFDAASEIIDRGLGEVRNASDWCQKS